MPTSRAIHLVPALISALAFAFVVPASARLKEAAMRLPDELAQTERVSVAGRQGWKILERLTFGEFSVHDVRRSLTKGGDLKINFYEGSKRRQSFGFTLSKGDRPIWRAEAATNVHRRALDVGVEVELRNTSGFAAQLAPVGAAHESWTLELVEKLERPLQGTLSRGGFEVSVKGTNRLAGTPLPLGDTSGYVFEAGGRPVAAVEVINNGAVWLSSEIDEELRDPVLTAISALLLFEELRKTLPE